MSEVVIAGVLSALLAGALGYTIAVVRRDTAIALLQQHHIASVERLDKMEEKIDRHLKIMIRLIVDFARQSGVQMRTADVLEITSLIGDEAPLR